MPMPDFSLASPEKVLEIVNELNDDNLRICLDTGHANVLGLDVAEEVYKIKDKLQVLHVHDNNYKLDMHLLPYCGTISWEKFGMALNNIGFNGAFSFEVVPPTTLPDDLFERAGKLLCDTAKYITDIDKRKEI